MLVIILAILVAALVLRLCDRNFSPSTLVLAIVILLILLLAYGVPESRGFLAVR